MTKILPSGKGWFIWQIERIYNGNVSIIAQKAKEQNISWVSIKVCDGYGDYNINLVQPLIDALTNVSIDVHGWGYTYLFNPIKEAQKAIEKVSQYKLKSFMVDAENEWKNKPNEAQSYMDTLRLGLPDTAIGLCSFRFPSLQSDFPWTQAVSKIDYHIPQVYWVTSHNPIDQLDRSVKELKLKKDVPVIPLGSAYKYEYGTWIPSEQELFDFNNEAEKLGLFGVGYYEWGDAIRAGIESYVGKLSWNSVIFTPIPEPTPTPVVDLQVKTLVNLNLRQLPNSTSKIIFTEPLGSVLASLESDSDTQSKVGKTGLWLNVKDNLGRVGYCSSFYLKLVDTTTPVPVPIPTTGLKPASLGANRILSDTELAEFGYQSRLAYNTPNQYDKLNSYPCTRRYNGGASTLMLSMSWQNYLKSISTDAQWKAMWVPQTGYHNFGDIGQTEQLTFANSYIWVKEIIDNKAYIDHYINTDSPPTTVYIDKYRVNNFIVIARDGHLFAANSGWMKVFIMAKNSTENLWIDVKYITSVMPDLPYEVTVQSSVGLNVRDIPSVGKIIKVLPYNTKVSILDFQKIGNGVWGKMSDGWIALWLTSSEI